MSLQDDYEKAKAKGKIQQVTMQIKAWEDEGDTLMGILLEITPFTLGKFDTEVNCYKFDVEGELVTVVLGSATDKQLKEVDMIGQKVRIEYRGKKMLEGGTQCNIFKVEVF